VTDGELEAAVDEIRDEYRRRDVAPQCAGQYSFLNRTHARLVLDRERAILDALSRHLKVAVDEAEVLDVGAGTGISLALLAAYGFDARRLHGVDIVASRVEQGRVQFPAFDLRVGDGYSLPWDDASFDVVQQITMLSSVHDPRLRETIAAEMRRVLRPGGLLLSFDVASVPVLPRLVNRAASAFGARRRRAVVSGAAETETRLTPVVPIDVPELERLTAPLAPVEVRRIGPYRPLVERTRSELAYAVLRALPGFGTTLLYVAR
jgi:ubiquinone/menaquinone biosynthesis C-methylase UbiE